MPTPSRKSSPRRAVCSDARSRALLPVRHRRTTRDPGVDRRLRRGALYLVVLTLVVVAGVVVAGVVVAGVVAAGTASAQRLTVLTISTAASLRDAFTELSRIFEKAHPQVRVRLNLASSGTLQRQIEQGAPVDVFASAGIPQMEALQREGLLLAGSRRIFAANRMALIVPVVDADKRKRDVRNFADLAADGVSRIAIGDPRSVPAGAYAKQVFEHLGLWTKLRAKLIFTTHVRQALEYTVRGEVSAAVVYVTDARNVRRRVRLVAVAEEAWHQPIRYPIAVLKESRHGALAAAFVDTVAGTAGRDVLQRFGFGTPP